MPITTAPTASTGGLTGSLPNPTSSSERQFSPRNSSQLPGSMVKEAMATSTAASAAEM